MNRFRILAALSIMLSFGGITLLSIDKTLGVVIMTIGLLPTVIFLTKAKKEESNHGYGISKQDRMPKREKKTILQWIILKIKENQGIQVMSVPGAKQQKKSILLTVIKYLKEKPATPEEINQLRLEAEKYRLKADIAKSKAVISGSKGGNFGLGGSSAIVEDKISGLLRGAVKTKDVDFFNSISIPDIFENQNVDDKPNKEKEAYRKRARGF